jgi:hypothetical protein
LACTLLAEQVGERAPWGEVVGGSGPGFVLAVGTSVFVSNSNDDSVDEISATTGKVDEWVYERIAQTYMLDPEMRDRLAKLNPTGGKLGDPSGKSDKRSGKEKDKKKDKEKKNKEGEDAPE